MDHCTSAHIERSTPSRPPIRPMTLTIDIEEGLLTHAANAEDLPLDAWARRVLVREARLVRHPTEPGILVRDLCEKFWTDYTGPRLKDTAAYRADARTLLATHVVPRVGDVDAELLTPLQVEDVRDAVLAERSPQTATHVLNRLRRMYEWARRRGIVRRTDNPASAKVVEYPRAYDVSGAVSAEKFYTRTEVWRVLAWADRHDTQYAALYALAIYTGMRLTEIRKLRWAAVSFDLQSIHVSDRKNGCDLPIPMHRALLSRLRVWLMQTRGGRLVGLVFPSRRGEKPWRRETISRRFAQAAKAAGVRHLPFHGLRHTAASLWAMTGMPLDQIAELLGQRKLEVTRRYRHLQADYLRERVDRVELGGERKGPGLAVTRPEEAENQADRKAE